MAHHIPFRLGVLRALHTASLAVVVGACSLSPEQLSLPGSIAPSDSRLASADRGPGLAVSGAAGAEARTPRIFPGTGQFTGSVENDRSGGRAQSKVDENGVTLNLVGASVQEVAKTVLGDVLGVNYTVSDKAKASITLSTAQPVSKDDLLKIFESILRSEGIGLSVENGVYRVLPADAVVGGATKWSNRNQRQVGSATSIVPLRYVSAAEMERVIKSVAPQSSILRVDSARNLLIVSGTGSELASINATVETFDLDWMRGMSFALLPVETGDPEAIARELDTIFHNDTDGPSKGVVRFVPNVRLKSVLVISSRPEYLRKAEGWLRRMDLAGQALEKQVQVYHVQNRSAGELGVLLRKVYSSQSNNGVEIQLSTQPQEAPAVLSSDGEDTGGNRNTGQGSLGGVAVTPARGSNSLARGSGGQVVSEPSAAGPATDENSRAGDGRGNRISIVADEANNSLIITATFKEYKRLREILGRIDVAPNQVLLEATIAEVTLTDSLKLGVKWFFQKGNNSATFTSNSLGDIVSGFPGFSYFLNTPNIQVALDALNSVTTVNLVSSPSLMVQDNKKAVLQIGDEVPIATAQQQSTITPGAPIINQISFRSTGVILGITPRIADDGRVQLEIEQEVSDVKRTESSDLNSPTISQRRIKTSVAVGDGESIVLAGLMRDRSEVAHGKVPLIGDMPVVGNLFKNKQDEITRTELLIAITPHVVRDQRQLKGVADEFRDRMNFSSRPQRGGPPDLRENVDRVIVR